MRVRRREIALHYVDVGAAQSSQQIFGVDLERLVEKTHGCVRVAPRPQHLALDVEHFGRLPVGGNRLVDHFVGIRPVQKLGGLNPWFHGIRIQPDCITQHLFGLVAAAQPGRGHTERRPDVAFEDRIPIAWFDHIDDIS